VLQSDLNYIKRVFKSYYYANYQKLVKEVSEYQSREWAFQTFDNLMVRHRSITNPDELKRYLEDPPKGVYYSLSLYEDPTAEMQEKGRVSTDLVFDLDADHIYGVMSKKAYVCRKCGYIGSERICDNCSDDASPIFIVDDLTIDDVIMELKRLTDKLENLLGISSEETKIFFSGLRGFHLHVESPPYINIDDLGRIELKDLLTLEGVDFKKVRSPKASIVYMVWRDGKKVLQKVGNKHSIPPLVKKILSTHDLDELSSLLKSVEVRNDKDEIKTWLRKLVGIHIDPAVLTDLSRLIRAPYSLHGKSSLIKNPVNMDDLESGGSYVIDKSMVMRGRTEVLIKYMPDLIWAGKEYHETYNERVILPESLAIYLVNINLAEDLKPVLF